MRVDGEVEGFFNAVAQAINRFTYTTRMAGTIREYRRAAGDRRIIAFAHEVHKGSTIRGQWFYADNEASKLNVWFHSVQELVRRCIVTDGVRTADLGPSGNDSFTRLKEKYGFTSVSNWKEYADYSGPFGSVQIETNDE